MGLSGVGPHVAAGLPAAAGDNPERMRSEAAFAKLCGACPIPAVEQDQPAPPQPGRRQRANNALFTIVLLRMRHDPATRAYVPRRAAEVKSGKEIMRCLKRFVAREVFGASLTHAPMSPPATSSASYDANSGSASPRRQRRRNDPTRLSNIERCRAHDTCRARRARAPG
jgi:hypothetical protein